MKALVGMVLGGVAGYFAGYFVVVTRADELSTLGKAMVLRMAPTAPDTMMFAAIGAAVGLVLGLVWPKGEDLQQRYEARHKPNAKPPAMDMRKLSKPDPAAEERGQSQQEALSRHRELIERGRRYRERKRGAA